MPSANNIWKGVLIEESLTDMAILPQMKIVGTKSTTLEGENYKGTFHFHNVEVLDDNLDKVIQFVSTHLRDSSWYFHLVKNSEMIVMFPNKVFRAHKITLKKSKKYDSMVFLKEF